MMRSRRGRCLLGVLLISTVHATPQEAAETLSFVTWREPNEGAFTISVPQAWKIGGGVRRRTPVDVRSAVNVVSPDGAIRLFIGDYDVPPAREPDQLTGAAGLREGQIYDGVLLARYQTGGEFARRYAGWKLCRQPQVIQAGILRRETEVLSAEVARYAGSMGLAASASVGEAIFRCGQAEGFVMATTLYSRPARGPGLSGWNVYRGTRRVCDDLGTCNTVDNSWTHVWRDHSGNVVPGPASGYPPDYSGQWTPMK